MKNKIFIAAPISAFDNEDLYSKNRQFLLQLIQKLRVQYEVYSEIENISNLGIYDTPGESAVDDFERIENSDIFILYHPMRVQTSSFIELGYAISKCKKIIIISKMKDLPYLAIGLPNISSNIKIIEMDDLSKIAEKIFVVFKEWI